MKIHTFVVLPVVLAFSTIALAGRPRPGDFPGYGILPKEETGAARFLHEHPEYDGRGVVVAIFDTGVDPGAPGLQVTSDGKPKIIDMVDGSGSGDVETSTVVEATDGMLAGLSGRQMKTDPSWHNPTGKYHLGLKRAFELYPGGLVSRLVAKRREKWDGQQRVAVTALERQLADWDAAHTSPTQEQKKEREEIELRLAQLKALQEKYDDPGPIFDCVVFNDGETWRVAIDTNENGELADEKLLTNYRLEHQYATFGSEDLFNFAVNVYDEGNLLSIVADAGAHGTHVAGIVAANFPDAPEYNGLAPGAQLVAVKIGDTRLGATSVGTGEVRGCVAVLQNKCDVINMSFGGPPAAPNAGRLARIYSEIVDKYNVIFVSSAGNEGPAISTAGAPGATTSSMLGIGAYLSPEMMEIEYSLRERLPATQYTWSSCGPTYDGDLGVKFSAPGGAIAPVPNWLLQGNMLMNGTSMAAPNCCGGIALILSGLKAEKTAYTPPRIRRALENTAVPTPGVEIFAEGRGLVQIDKAYEYVKQYAEYADQDLRFDVHVTGRQNARGIYLREPYECDQPLTTQVTVTPVFHEDADNREKVAFEMQIKLETTERWVEVAEYLVLMHGGRNFDVRVDPTGLPAGIQYAEIRGYDAASLDRGPVWRLPITVVRPQALDQADPVWHETLSFKPEQIERRFFAVPEGATWADIDIRRLDAEGPRRLFVHALQLVPGVVFDQTEFKQYLTMTPGGHEVHSFPVVAGRTLEVCLAQYWSSLGASEYDISLTFHGVVPDDFDTSLDGSEVATRLGVTAPLRKERLAPSGSLETLRQPLRPTKAEVRPLDGQRDLLPEGRQIYELVLTYEFKLDEEARIYPRVAMMGIKEFEESWEAQIWMIFDSTKRLVATGTTKPDPVKLSKGDYVVRFQVRNDNLEQLEKLKDMVCMLNRVVDPPVGLRFYADPGQALGGGKLDARVLDKGARATFWVSGTARDKLPKAAKSGDLLLGKINFAANDENLPGEGKRPGGYPVSYVVPPPVKEEAKDKDAGEKDKDEKPQSEQVAEAIRDAKVAQLSKLYEPANRELFDRLTAEILKDYSSYMPVLREELKRADGKEREKDLPTVIAVADRIIAQIDQDQLAAHYGVKLDPDDKAAAKVRKEMDKQKEALVDALFRKARALFDLAMNANPEARQAAVEDFEQAFGLLQKWVDTTGDEYLMLHIDRLAERGQLGEALKLLNKRIADSKPDKELFAKRIKLLDRLGWAHWKQYEEKWLLLRFPTAYPPF